MSFLNLNHLQINFGVDQFAIQDFSLEVAHGEFVVLLGPSGSGKTTILRMIAGLERPAKGKIVLGGKDISHLPPHQRNLTMVFQNYPTYPHLSVRGNLEFPLRCKNISKAKRKEQIHQVAESLGLNELLGRKPGDLSGGERQRVALGKGLIQQPEVFLLDEPLSHLDAQLRVKLRQELREILKARKQTVLYVTHDQEEALALADRLVILRKGTLEQVDTPKNIFQNPATSFVAGFIGNPGMNL